MSRHINKAELISKVRQLTGLTNDEKSALLELLNEKKMYGLVWENHEEAVEEQLREQLPVFREVPERRILSDDADAPNHIIIEAENLHALVALTYTHAGKIDVMYLDPPYNTGNKDFVYNDSYVDSEDSYRHSKWLSFMEKRLKIAKTLLSDKGVIFISIDDNEQANLKLLCDDLFAPSNFCGEFIWRKKSGGGQTDQFFVTEHEYVLVYRKSLSFSWLDKRVSIDLSNFKFEDERGKYNLTKLEKWGSAAHREDRPKMYFPILNPDGLDYYPVAPDGKPGRWRVGMQRMEDLIKNNLVEWKRNVPYEKTYYKEDEDNTKVLKARSILYTIGETGDGSNVLTDIFGEKDSFSNPKPVSLIKELISHNNSGVILDFFAGSGTTMHAAMQLNAEDGGHRQCILVTNNENGICENVTYERNKRVIQGYTTPKGEQVEGLTKNNLRYYKADFISREPSSKNKRELVKAATDLLCIKENLYEEVKMTCNGKTLRKDYARRFVDGDKEMIIIYEPAVIKYIVEELKTWGQKEFIKIYVFSEGRYAYDDDFKDVIEKVTLCALPDAIYQAYRRVLPQRKKAQQIETMVADEEMKEALADAESYSYQEKKGGEA